MPFCPKCHCEFRDGFNVCNTCGVRLVPELPPDDAAPVADSPFVFLKNVEDGPLGESTISILRAYNIPFKTFYSDASTIVGLYTGRSLTGVDIYVPRDVFDEAIDLITNATFDLTGEDFDFLYVEPDTEQRGEVDIILQYYRAHSGVPVDAALDEGGRMHVLVCDEHVAAAVHVSAKGRLSVFFAENYMDNATFDAAIAEGLRMVREDGRIGAW
ncbi:MAG: hypothetical protein RR994_06350, partial [Clostridia bacterium]